MEKRWTICFRGVPSMIFATKLCSALAASPSWTWHSLLYNVHFIIVSRRVNLNVHCSLFGKLWSRDRLSPSACVEIGVPDHSRSRLGSDRLHSCKTLIDPGILSLLTSAEGAIALIWASAAIIHSLKVANTSNFSEISLLPPLIVNILLHLKCWW